MPTRIAIWERRDNGDRNVMGLAALALCREARKADGISSAKFYWGGTEDIVFLFEGEAPGIGAPFASGDAAILGKATFDMADNAKQIRNYVLAGAKAGEDAYKASGRG
jgi:hypothetical protein